MQLDSTMTCPCLRAPRIEDHADRRVRVFLCVRGLRDSPQAQARRLLRVLFLWGRSVSANSGGASQGRE